MNDRINQIINAILNSMIDGEEHPWQLLWDENVGIGEEETLKEAVMHEMRDANLIELIPMNIATQRSLIKLKPLGSRIILEGGWINWNERLEHEKQMRIVSLTQANSVIQTNQWMKRTSWVQTIIFALTLVVYATLLWVSCEQLKIQRSAIGEHTCDK